MRVKLHKLIMFITKQLARGQATLLAANILHELQNYNLYVPAFEELLVPIEWPRSHSLTSALSQQNS